MDGKEHRVKLPDGIVIFAREYVPHGALLDGRPVVFFLHGLTRNHKDSHDVAAQLAVAGWRCFAWDTRGRGLSDYDAEGRYTVQQYADDLVHVVAGLALSHANVCFVCTSMGALILMQFCGSVTPLPVRICGCVFVDIGPVIETAGLVRIAGYINKPFEVAPPSSYAEAAERAFAVTGPVFPRIPRESDFWVEWAKRAWRPSADSTALTPNYDQRIVTSFGQGVPLDYKALFVRLMDVVPHLLVIRGELSDLLSADGVEAMRTLAGAGGAGRIAEVVQPQVGHAPMLSEPESAAALRTYLTRSI